MRRNVANDAFDRPIASMDDDALSFGDRRTERTATLQLESRWKLSNEWALVSALEATRRRNNFPNYEPGVFPRSARYSVDWSYDNWQLLFGLEYANTPRQEIRTPRPH